MRDAASSIYDQEHEDFRRTARAFLDKEVVPFHEQWEKDGQVDRAVWTKAGAMGLLCFDVDEEYGGAGAKDFRYNMVLAEEIGRAGASGLGFPVHSDIIVPYISQLGTDEQKQRWLPGLVSGELISAIAMTEPGAGSDLQGVRTSAVDKGDHYLVNGSKTFISNGILADLVIVVARTDPDAGHQGISLLVLERGMPGFERGRNLDKMGLKAQDTAELSFDNVEVPKENLLGPEGSGFISLMQNLPQERISIAAIAVAACEHVLELCLAYAKEREAFGRPIGSFQHNRFLLAEMATEVAHRSRLRQRLRAPPQPWRGRHRARLDGQVVDHRAAEEGRRPGRAALRRLRLHERVPHRQGVRRQPDPDHLRRHDRDPEGDHRAFVGHLIVQFCSLAGTQTSENIFRSARMTAMSKRWVWPLLIVLVWLVVGGPLGSFSGRLAEVQENDNRRSCRRPRSPRWPSTPCWSSRRTRPSRPRWSSSASEA